MMTYGEHVLAMTAINEKIEEKMIEHKIKP